MQRAARSRGYRGGSQAVRKVVGNSVDERAEGDGLANGNRNGTWDDG